MDKGLRDGQAAVERAEQGRVRHEDVAQGNGRVVGGHVEGPFVASDDEAGGGARDDEGGDAGAGALGPGGACEDDAVRGAVHVGLPRLCAVEAEPLLRRGRVGGGDGGGVHARGVAAVLGFREAEGEAVFSRQSAGDEFFFLGGGAVAEEHDDVGEVADDAVFVLEVVEET